jgi:hypothetical protein
LLLKVYENLIHEKRTKRSRNGIKGLARDSEAIMPKKRSTQSGSNSATAKLISRINKFGQNVINNTSFDQGNELSPRNSNHLSFDDDDDEVFVLTAKQKQQVQRNEYLESLTKEQLKIEAKRRGQKTAGTKTELVQFV